MTQPRSFPTRLSIAGAVAAISFATLAAPVAAAPSTQSASDDAMLYTKAASTSSVVTVSQGSLSEAETADILFMREEEKLAHDVYVTLGALWGTPIFSNIARAETSHMDSVASLIERYGLDDPVDDNPVGVFVDPPLQAMYDDLVASGSQSLTDALMVGALIEEVDIEDLIDSIDETEATDVALVWQRLLSGSQNHLKAFTSQLATQGIDYEPTVLDAATYDQMLSEANQGNGGHGDETGSDEGHQRGHGRSGDTDKGRQGGRGNGRNG